MSNQKASNKPQVTSGGRLGQAGVDAVQHAELGHNLGHELARTRPYPS